MKLVVVTQWVRTSVLSQSSIFGAKSKNRVSEIQRLTDCQTLEKATLRQNPRKRCQRCDIPLGPQPCPNPQCREPHGQSVGALCAWCHHHQEGSRNVRNAARLPESQCEVLSRASARLGGVAGPMDGVPRADPVWEPGDGSHV